MNYSREKALNSLRERIKDATSLVICDPYILSIKESDDAKEYVRQLRNVLPVTLTKLVLVHSQKDENPLLREIIIQVSPQGFQLYTFRCPSIHDRVWIINKSSAFVTGTSFNSIGYRLSFINDLSQDDFKDFWHFLVKEMGEDFKKALFLS